MFPMSDLNPGASPRPTVTIPKLIEIVNAVTSDGELATQMFTRLEQPPLSEMSVPGDYQRRLMALARPPYSAASTALADRLAALDFGAVGTYFLFDLAALLYRSWILKHGDCDFFHLHGVTAAWSFAQLPWPEDTEREEADGPRAIAIRQLCHAFVANHIARGQYLIEPTLTAPPATLDEKQASERWERLVEDTRELEGVDEHL
mmetsp:Transcript_21327/g.50512  ORF Transcript_21327/g.50512 Transcript_21327/m.50512 type:complete len:204 (-) Transcript_21327:19-630(-)